ncbi:MAG TPA: CBS domain-containing protein [Gammaproteobacteria bacterium]|nr:CBS domain-containing protein [Gammaproteobacteria bacterium]
MLTSFKVREYMTVSRVSFLPEQDILQAVHILLSHQLSGAPVIDQYNNLLGFLSEKDCIQVALNAAYQQDHTYGQVAEYMSSGVITVDIDSAVVDAAQLFLNNTYKCYPVMDNHQVVGFISRLHILRALAHVAEPTHSD